MSLENVSSLCVICRLHHCKQHKTANQYGIVIFDYSMLSVQSGVGCMLTIDTLLRAELRGGLPAKLLRDGTGRCGLRVNLLRAMMWQNLRCGLTAGQVTAGRGGAGCGPGCAGRGGLLACSEING